MNSIAGIVVRSWHCSGEIGEKFFLLFRDFFKYLFIGKDLIHEPKSTWSMLENLLVVMRSVILLILISLNISREFPLDDYIYLDDLDSSLHDDIIFEDYKEDLYQDSEKKVQIRSVIKDPVYRWKDGIIYYYIDEVFSKWFFPEILVTGGKVVRCPFVCEILHFLLVWNVTSPESSVDWDLYLSNHLFGRFF